MSDACLSVLAALFELCIPAALIVIYVRAVRTRSWVIVVLGALAPWICLYGYGAVAYLINPGSSNAFGFYAMWVMTFIPYVVSLFLGLGLCIVRRPQHLLVRFLLGFVPVACGFIWVWVRH